MLTDPLGAIGAGRAPDMAGRLALVAGGVELSFADLSGRVERASAALTATGVGHGSRVALRATNRLETVVIVHALSEIGAPLVPIHPRLTDAETGVLLRDASPDRVLDDAAVDELLASAPGVVPRPPPAPGLAAPVQAIVYTSGTTGRPKGAVLGREAFVASAIASAENLSWMPEDRWLLCMPLCHVGGLSILTRCLIARRPVILEPRFDPPAVLASLARHRATLLSVVPTMLGALLDEDRSGVLARLRVVLVGGAAAPPALLEECAARGVPALTTYGLTEACSQVTAQRPSAERRSAPEPGCGRPLRGVELSIMDGRIHVRGVTRMRGYRGEPELAPEAWIDTGDLGEVDEQGRLFVYARRTDLIVTGGENVYPAEVEQVLESCDGVGGALVFGVPDARWGQLVAAAIVPAARGPFDASRLARALAARLAPHKRPRAFCRVDAVPLTALGKPDRAGAAARFGRELEPLLFDANP